MLKIAITLGSTRPGRNGEAVAKWVYDIAQKREDAEFELVDIKDFNLPLLDEPVPPSLGQYSKPHTKAWAAKVGIFDGFVFVTPGRPSENSTALPLRSRAARLSARPAASSYRPRHTTNPRGLVSSPTPTTIGSTEPSFKLSLTIAPAVS